MPTLTEARIADLLQPYLTAGEGESLMLPLGIISQLSTYLDLLLRWNARTNLTAIREPEEIVTRHFGESLFLVRHLQPRLAPTATLLDFGSGAGFPGIPVQLASPQRRVTLAESQGKKASFLREAARALNLNSEVWAQRVEAMPAALRFDAVTMRAVDKMEEAVAAATERVESGGWLAVLGSSADTQTETSGLGAGTLRFAVPNSTERILLLTQR